MSTLIIPSIRGYRPIKVDLPKYGEYIFSRGVAYQTEIDHPYHEVIVEPCEDEPGEVLYKIPVHGVPAGYKPVGYGSPKEGTYSIDSLGKLLKWSKGDYCSQQWLLLEPVTNTVKVSTPPGYKPVAIRPPNRGELYVAGGKIIESPHDNNWPTRLVVEPIEPPEEVELEVEVPEGYQPVRWGTPETGDLWVGSCGQILDGLSAFERLIVTCNRYTPSEPLGQEAWFCDDPADGWETGTLEGIGKNKEGETLFIDEEDTAWKRCEVQPCQR